MRVTNDGTTEADRLVDLRVFVGLDKSWWPEVAPRETVSVVLNPSGDPPNLMLSFKSHGVENHWSGPELEMGSGYTIGVSIGADGGVEEDHCRMPCSLR